MYSVKDLAKMFNVSNQTIKNWVERYNIPHQYTMGGHLRFTDESINEIKELLKQKYNM